jgi:hypothetical protein
MYRGDENKIGRKKYFNPIIKEWYLRTSSVEGLVSQIIDSDIILQKMNVTNPSIKNIRIHANMALKWSDCGSEAA